jgi:hypothetical protein
MYLMVFLRNCQNEKAGIEIIGSKRKTGFKVKWRGEKSFDSQLNFS